ncbi:RING-type E3 ubiquitin transferase [Sarracenia purpurea var. burkii]
MGSTGSPISRAVPYDCTQGICSTNCPQWCFTIFPPPPPPPFGPFPPDSDSDSDNTLSPLIVAFIGIFAGAFLLVTYYAIISNYRRRRSDRSPDASETEPNRNQTNQERRLETAGAEAEGLDEATVKSIAIRKSENGEVDGRSECPVCLGEFGEDEKVRVLPKCRHAFHLRCIDAWLKSHTDCPLCRANVVHPAGDTVADPYQQP